MTFKNSCFDITLNMAILLRGEAIKKYFKDDYNRLLRSVLRRKRIPGLRSSLVNKSLTETFRSLKFDKLHNFLKIDPISFVKMIYFFTVRIKNCYHFVISNNRNNDLRS